MQLRTAGRSQSSPFMHNVERVLCLVTCDVRLAPPQLWIGVVALGGGIIMLGRIPCVPDVDMDSIAPSGSHDGKQYHASSCRWIKTT